MYDRAISCVALILFVSVGREHRFVIVNTKSDCTLLTDLNIHFFDRIYLYEIYLYEIDREKKTERRIV